MINRLIQKLRLMQLRSTIGSFDQFRGLTSEHGHPFDPQIISANTEKLRPVYENYVQNISSPEMAASLELAAFLYTLCSVNQYTRLLDLGSGLSSYVLRLYAKETPGVTVYSVDDDEAWLKKTRGYLEEHKLGTESMFTLDEFLATNESGFDCILHDLNFVEIRINYIDQVLAMVKTGGLIIFDDVHKPDYQLNLLKKLALEQVKTFSLQPVTEDRFGRFSMACIRTA